MLTAALRDVLDRWPETPGDAQVCAVTPGFSGAAVFRVSTHARTWCVRRWPTGASALPDARVLELHRWLAFLAQAGVGNVAVPVPAREGPTIVQAHGARWQLEPWLPGAADFHERPTDVRLRSAFIALANLHLAAERYVPTAEGAQWFTCGHGVPSAIVERLEKLRRLTTRTQGTRAGPLIGDSVPGVPAGELVKLLTVVAPRIAAELGQIAETRVRLHPCLRDVWHDHMLFTGDEVTGIIDASAARTENVASDLSRLLGSVLGDASDRWETALAAYSAVRPLSSDERRLIPVLDRSGVVLSAAHWLERMSAEPLNARESQRVIQVSQRVFALL